MTKYSFHYNHKKSFHPKNKCFDCWLNEFLLNGFLLIVIEFLIICFSYLFECLKTIECVKLIFCEKQSNEEIIIFNNKIIKSKKN